MQSQFSLLFGGIFSTLEEAETISPEATPIKSPYYSKAVSKLTRFLELGLYTEILSEDVLNWVNSEVLDDVAKNKKLVWKHFNLSKWYLETFPHVYSDDVIFGATCYGNLELVKWLVERYSLTDLKEVFIGACNTGQLEICQWIVKEDKLPLREDELTLYEMFRFLAPSKNPFQLASKCCEKHVNIFRWAYENDPTIPFPWIKSLKKGYFDLLKFMAEKQPDKTFTDFELTRDLENSLYKNASLEMLKWVSERWLGVLNTQATKIFDLAIHDQEKVDWLMEMPHNRFLSILAIHILIKKDLKLAEYILDKYPQAVHTQEELVFRLLCRDGNVEAVKWFTTRYPETNVYAQNNEGLRHAFYSSNWKLAKWFLENHREVYMKVLKRIWKKVFKRLSGAVLRFPRFVLSYIR